MEKRCYSVRVIFTKFQNCYPFLLDGIARIVSVKWTSKRMLCLKNKNQKLYSCARIRTICICDLCIHLCWTLTIMCYTMPIWFCVSYKNEIWKIAWKIAHAAHIRIDSPSLLLLCRIAANVWLKIWKKTSRMRQSCAYRGNLFQFGISMAHVLVHH